jgi:hypothetical protein
VVSGALRGNALAAFPEEAFSKDVVIQRFFGREHILLQRPEAIRHVLIDNAQNYRRSPTATRVLRPMFGRGLFLSAGLCAADGSRFGAAGCRGRRSAGRQSRCSRGYGQSDARLSTARS